MQTDECYQKWVKEDISTLASEEDVDLSLVPMGKMSKIDGVKIVNRKLDPKTGEMKYSTQTFNKGDKVQNFLE